MKRSYKPLFVILFSAFCLLGTQANAQFSRVVTTDTRMKAPAGIDSLFLHGHFVEAAAAFDSVIATSNNLTGAEYYNRGILERLLEKGSGLTFFEKAEKRTPESYLTQWGLGIALTDEGLLEKGEDHLRKAVGLDKGYYESSVELGRNLRLQGKLGAAEKAIRKAFGRDRTYSPAFVELAAIYRQEGDFAGAEEILTKGYEKFPYEDILIDLIRLRQIQHQHELLKPLCQEYLTLYPKGPNRMEVTGMLEALEAPVALNTLETYAHTTYKDGKPYVDAEEALPLGKRLNYDVRWGPIHVGDLHIEIVDGSYENEEAWFARYIVNSSPGLPFIAIQDTFYAHLDRDLRFTHRMEMHYNENDYRAVKVYISDYETGYYEARNWYGDGFWSHSRHPQPPNSFDATSQLWMAQQLVLKRIGGKATVELSGGFERTTINHRGVDGDFKLNGKKVDLIKLDGIMPYAGIAGLTGDFQGWYTADETAIPVLAKFKIFLGWVKLKYDSTTPSPLQKPEKLSSLIDYAKPNGQLLRYQ